MSSDEAGYGSEADDNGGPSETDGVLHHKHPVVKLVREQIKNVDSDIEIKSIEITAGCGVLACRISSKATPSQKSLGGGDEHPRTGSSTSTGSKIWEKKGLILTTLLLLLLVWLVLMYGALLGANLCNGPSCRPKCSLKLSLPHEANQLYTRSVF